MAVRHSRAVQQLSSATRQAESRPGRIGPISLDMKQMEERSAGNPHAAFDVEGTGDVARHRPTPARQSSTLRVSSEGWHVQQGQTCRGRSQSPVVWIAEEMETEPSKPIDKTSRGGVTSHRAVTTVNALWPRK